MIDMENWLNINYFHNETPLTVITINYKTIKKTMHLHLECHFLSTNSRAYLLDEAVIASALPRMMATGIC